METIGDMQLKANLAKKLLKVLEAVENIEKSGRNTKQGYNFVRATDLMDKVRKEFVTHGIQPTMSSRATDRFESKANSGATIWYAGVETSYSFIDTDTGFELGPFTSVGWGQDTGDKGIYKAITGAMKYALRGFFLVPDVDPEEDTGPEEGDGKPQQARRQTNVGKLKPSTEPNRGHGNEGMADKWIEPGAEPDPPKNPLAAGVAAVQSGHVPPKGQRVLIATPMSVHSVDKPKAHVRIVTPEQEIYAMDELVMKAAQATPNQQCVFFVEDKKGSQGQKRVIVRDIRKVGPAEFKNGVLGAPEASA
jgi:hypothetical protein